MLVSPLAWTVSGLSRGAGVAMVIAKRVDTRQNRQRIRLETRKVRVDNRPKKRKLDGWSSPRKRSTEAHKSARAARLKTAQEGAVVSESIVLDIDVKGDLDKRHTNRIIGRTITTHRILSPSYSEPWDLGSSCNEWVRTQAARGA